MVGIVEELRREIEALDIDQGRVKQKIGNKLEQAAEFIQNNGGNNLETANSISYLVQAYSLFLISERIKELIKVYRFYKENDVSSV